MADHSGRADRSPGGLAPRQPRAIHSALTVLEAVAMLGVGTTAQEIARELGLPRATTYRLVNLLVEDEYLVRTPDLHGFALGAKVARLAAAAAQPRLSTAAREVVSQVRASVRGGVQVVLFDSGRVIVADEDPDFPLSDGARLMREPDRFAIGRLMLITASATQRGGALDEAWVAAAAADLRTLGSTRQVGELVPGFGCLAVPIPNSAGGAAGALSFAGPSRRIESPAEVIQALAPAAARLGPLVT